MTRPEISEDFTEGEGLDEVRLDLERVLVEHHVPVELFPGAHQTLLTIGESPITAMVAGEMVMRLSAHVMTEPAGDAVHDTVTALLPLRPRWLPQWLWRRIPTRPVTWTLTVRPRWSYPQASTRLDGLGPGVRRARTERRRVGEPWTVDRPR